MPLLLATLCTSAKAQSNVTMYGYLDLGIVKRSGESAGLARGYNNWLGIHGKEDLGSGLQATFRLETRFNPDTGESERPRTFWQGESTVGLHSDTYGTLRLGRALTPLWDAAWQYEPWINSGFNASLAAYQTGSYTTDGINDTALGFADATRISQGVYYQTPKWQGFFINTAIKVARDPDANARPRSVSFNYAAHNWSAALAHEANARRDDITYLAGKYKMQALTVMASWTNHRLADAERERMWLLAGTYDIGRHMLRGGYGKNQDNGQQKVSTGYVHKLSKRTSLYADVYRERQDRYRNGLALGMTHSF
ncbi:porin [uncultured Oxalicibacterium sp.]|uniref:porin n=1 Tax=uncultured Oxalicibacterium sp. TaxID=1168540 RepID=UPI0025E5122C|nr:porin [uncultured Oxalicibacterium sp.]